MIEIRSVTVLGAGTMGHGIAQVAAAAGCEVVLRDVDEPSVARGLERIKENLEGAVSRGKLSAADRDAAIARLMTTTSLERSVAKADLVIEAIPEDLALKEATFRTIDGAAPEHALFATNTSSLPVAAIARATTRPERVVGMHFFNPVHIMKLVEIVRHPGSSPESVEAAVAFGARLGKDPIVVADVAGFASSRLGVLTGLEATRMLEEGVASAADIDKAMKLGYGHPMGPLELGDLVGLDVRLAIARHLARELGPRFQPPALLEKLVAEGKLGKKTGQGFYRWENGKIVTS
jgi:3-hydroxybutyryl-CoA dehydrogenase